MVYEYHRYEVNYQSNWRISHPPHKEQSIVHDPSAIITNMEEIKNTIYELETSLLKPEVRSSFDQLNHLLADDFKEFGSSGLVYTKQSVLERLPLSTDKVIYVVSDFEIKNLSKEVVMANFKTDRVINDTEKVSSLRTSLWRKEDSGWRMFFHQGTPIK